jgi:hypothetical protein
MLPLRKKMNGMDEKCSITQKENIKQIKANGGHCHFV